MLLIKQLLVLSYCRLFWNLIAFENSILLLCLDGSNGCLLEVTKGHCFGVLLVLSFRLIVYDICRLRHALRVRPHIISAHPRQVTLWGGSTQGWSWLRHSLSLSGLLQLLASICLLLHHRLALEFLFALLRHLSQRNWILPTLSTVDLGKFDLIASQFVDLLLLLPLILPLINLIVIVLGNLQCSLRALELLLVLVFLEFFFWDDFLWLLLGLLWRIWWEVLRELLREVVEGPLGVRVVHAVIIVLLIDLDFLREL